MRMRRIVSTLLLLVAAPLLRAACVLPASDRAFLDSAVQAWEAVRAGDLQLAPAPLPTFIVFDQHCVWRDGRGSSHDGTIRLPDGNEIPARVMSFASTHEGKAFLVFALPAIWRAEERYKDDPRLELRLRSVFIHEMTHTRQSDSLGARLTELETQHKIENLNDDIVQQRFASRDGFTAAFEKERDLLYAIANESDAKRRRSMMKEAARAIDERRAGYFIGDDAFYAELEEIFLGMEGLANWAGFRAAMRAGLTRDEAIALMQGSRKWFSQDEGLALFLAIDALHPHWQKRVLDAKPAPAFQVFTTSP
jgi:hypothetical protein